MSSSALSFVLFCFSHFTVITPWVKLWAQPEKTNIYEWNKKRDQFLFLFLQRHFHLNVSVYKVFFLDRQIYCRALKSLTIIAWHNLLSLRKKVFRLNWISSVKKSFNVLISIKIDLKRKVPTASTFIGFNNRWPDRLKNKLSENLLIEHKNDLKQLKLFTFNFSSLIFHSFHRLMSISNLDLNCF